MRIGVDLDGVIYDFTNALARWLVANERYTFEQCTTPRRWEFYLDWGMSLERFIEVCNEAADAGYLFRSGVPINDAARQLNRLIDHGHTVHIITDRSFGSHPIVSQDSTRWWLRAYRIPYHTLTFSADKTSVPVDMMIDDRPENYAALRAAGVDAWLQNRPHNAGYFARQRLSTLSQFVATVLTTGEQSAA